MEQIRRLQSTKRSNEASYQFWGKEDASTFESIYRNQNSTQGSPSKLAARRHQTKNYSIDLTTNQNFNHLPTNDMRARAAQEYNYQMKYAEKKSAGLKLLQKFQEQNETLSPRLQTIFKNSIMDTRRQQDHPTGDKWWIPESQNSTAPFSIADSRRQLQPDMSAELTNIQSPGFAFEQKTQKFSKTANGFFSQSLKPQPFSQNQGKTTRNSPQVIDSSSYKEEFSPLQIKDNENFSLHSTFDRSNPNTGNNLAENNEFQGASSVDQAIRNFKQEGVWQRRTIAGQGHAQQSYTPYARSNEARARLAQTKVDKVPKILLNSQQAAAKVLPKLRTYTPATTAGNQSISTPKQPISINRDTMLLDGVEERRFLNSTVNQHIHKTLDSMPTQGKYMASKLGMKKIHIVKQSSLYANNGRFVKVHRKLDIVDSLVEKMAKHAALLDQQKITQAQQLELMTERSPDSKTQNISHSPRRRTVSNFNQSKDGSPQSKLERLLNTNIIIDSKPPGSPTRSRDTFSATFNTIRDGQMVKKFNIQGAGSALADVVSEQAEFSSMDGDGAAVKGVEQYLMERDPKAIIALMDKQIEQKKAENPTAYYAHLNHSSILSALKPKRAQIFVHPCLTKMKMFKFLSEAYKTNHRFEIDFNDPEFKQDCTHNFAEDHAQEFIQNIYIWIDQYEQGITDFKREKVDKEKLYTGLYKTIMESKGVDYKDLKERINSPEDLRDFIIKNHLDIKHTLQVKTQEKTDISIGGDNQMKILIYEQENKISIPEGIYNLVLSQLIQTPIQHEESNEQSFDSKTSQKSTEEQYFNYVKVKLNQILERNRLEQEKISKKNKEMEKEIAKQQARSKKNNPESMQIQEKKQNTMDVVKLSLVEAVKKQVKNQFSDSIKTSSVQEIKPIKETLQLFTVQQKNLEFYDTTKKLINNPNSTTGETKELYYDQVDCKGLPQPIFSKIQNNTLQLTGDTLPKGQARALKNFLIKNKDVPQYQILDLILDDCWIVADEIVCLFQGIQAQNKIQRISLQGVTIDSESCRIICEILEQGLNRITQINLSAIKIQQKHLLSIMENLAECGKLKRLTLNGLNLGGQVDGMEVMMCLQKVIIDIFDLQDLNLSYCSLSGNELILLGEALIQNQNLGSLNLSHLDLSHTSVSKEKKVNQFLISLNEWISHPDQSKNLSHLDLSGMNLKRDNVIQLTREIVKHPTILAVHLGDNNLDSDCKNYVLKQFGVDVSQYYKSCEEQANRFNNIDEWDIAQDIEKEGKSQKQKEIGFVDHQVKTNNHEQAKIINAQLVKTFKDQKIAIQSYTLQGRNKKQFIQDPFILTRILGHEELIFNQNRKKNRLLDFSNGDGKWQLQTSENECYVCNRWAYVTVYFRVKQLNNQFEQITNQKLIKELRKVYKLEKSESQNCKPIILGTLTNSVKTSMIQAKHFAGLLMQTSLAMGNESKINPAFVLKAVRQELQLIIQQEGDCLDDKKNNKRSKLFSDYLTNWRSIIKNNLKDSLDHQSINYPVFMPEFPKEDDIYIYSGFVSPGRHSIIIYLPTEDTFYLRSILVQHRNAELDLIDRTVVPSKTGITPVRNVFYEWQETNLEEFQLAIESDWNSRHFKVKQKLLKNGIKLPKVREIITTNSIMLIQLYEFIIINSVNYPRCNTQDIRNMFEEIGVSESNGWAMIDFDQVVLQLNPKIKVITKPDQQNENSDEEQKPIIKEPTLNRAQFIDLLLRLCLNQEQSLNMALLSIINKNIVPYLLKNRRNIFRQQQIHQPLVNDLLYVNIDNLKNLYQKYFDYGFSGFPFKSLYRLINPAIEGYCGVEYACKWFPVEQIKIIMASSKMTVIEDEIQIKKYEDIAFVELLEFIVRSAEYMMSEQAITAMFGPQEEAINSDLVLEKEKVTEAPKQSSAIKKIYEELIELAAQGLEQKVERLLQLILNAQPPEQKFALVNPLEYEYLGHEKDESYDIKIEQITPYEQKLGFNASISPQIKDIYDIVLKANKKLQDEENKIQAQKKAFTGFQALDFDDDDNPKQNEEPDAPFNLQRMDFVNDGADIVDLQSESVVDEETVEENEADNQ